MCKSICGVNCKECPMNTACKGCINTNGNPFGGGCLICENISNCEDYKQKMIEKINSLNIKDLPKVTELFSLLGSYVNLEYSLPNDDIVKFLDDNRVYLGCQLEKENDNRCYGVIVDKDFILISDYQEMGENPRLVLFKKLFDK